MNLDHVYQMMDKITDDVIEKIKLEKGKTLIASYSKKRAKKDAFDREKNITRLQKKLKRLKNPKEYLSNFGYKKYLKIEGDTVIELDEDKIKEAEKWDGLHGMVTNIKNPEAQEIHTQYSGLWQIIRNALVHVQFSILKDVKSYGKKYVVPSKISEDARLIYNVMGKKYSQTPYCL